MATTRLGNAITRGALAIPVSILVMSATHGEEVETCGQGDEPCYLVFDLPSLGGTESGGRTINNRGMVSGFSDLPGDATRHAVLWEKGRLSDLGALGGPDTSSGVFFTVKNNRGMIVGSSETDEIDPENEDWSCRIFHPTSGRVCSGFVWERGLMRELPTHGGRHGFAAGANNRGQVVGWAQTTFEDPTCLQDEQVNVIHQFLGALWNARTGEIEVLPPLPGTDDSVSTGNAINDKGQVVGISGICDQAVGRHSARHAVLWDNGTVIDLGNLGADTWNTPVAINQRGEVVGFAGLADDDGVVRSFGAFYWTRQGGIRPLGALGDDTHSEAWDINNRGEVVGMSCTGVCSAFLWKDEVLMDLNDLVQDGYPRHLRRADGINDRGVITGQSEHPDTGERRAFVAIPRR